MRSSNVFFGWLGVVRVRQETRKKLGWALGHMGNRSLGSSFGQWVWLWKHARQRRQWEQLGLPGAAMALLYEAQGIAPSAAVAAAAAMERPPPQRQQPTVGMGRGFGLAVPGRRSSPEEDSAALIEELSMLEVNTTARLCSGLRLRWCLFSLGCFHLRWLCCRRRRARARTAWPARTARRRWSSRA